MMIQTIHIRMRLYSLNKHPKYDDTNHPYLDDFIKFTEGTTTINHLKLDDFKPTNKKHPKLDETESSKIIHFWKLIIPEDMTLVR